VQSGGHIDLSLIDWQAVVQFARHTPTEVAMIYFAYDDLADPVRFASVTGVSTDAIMPATAMNVRLRFHEFSVLHGGGVADIAYTTGRRVAGIACEITAGQLERIEAEYERQACLSDVRPAPRRRIIIQVEPRVLRAPRRPASAVSHQSVAEEWLNVPPTPQYLSRLIEAGIHAGATTSWIEQLRAIHTCDFDVDRGGLQRHQLSA
jgi:hypothetical protein